MKPIFELFKRVVKDYAKDLGSIIAETYNEASGSNKVMIVEPVVKQPVGANDIIPAGSYVKVTGTSYTLRLLGKAHSPAKHYKRNEVAVSGGKVYVAEQDIVPGAFDASFWKEVAPETVGPVTIAAGSVVCVGRYHNNVNAAGWIVEDDSEIVKVEK